MKTFSYRLLTMLDQKNKQDGFITIAMISLIPILILFLFAILFLKSFLMPVEKSLHICRTRLLDLQVHAGKSISEILSLNKDVRLLRVQRNLAQQALMTAIASEIPPAIQAAQLALEQVRSLQTLLSIRQQALIQDANFKIRHDLLQTELSVQHIILNPNFRFHNLTSSISDIAVRPVRSSGSGPPEFELQPSFIEAQAQHVSWILDSVTNTWEILKWHPQPIHFRGFCSATLKESEGSFQAVLTDTRPLGKY